MVKRGTKEGRGREEGRDYLEPNITLSHRYNMTTPMGQQLYVMDNHIKVKLPPPRPTLVPPLAGEVCVSHPGCLRCLEPSMSLYCA